MSAVPAGGEHASRGSSRRHLALTLLLAGGCASSALFGVTAEELERSVWKISAAPCNTPGSGMGVGTAFLISENGVFLTADHVVKSVNVGQEVCLNRYDTLGHLVRGPVAATLKYGGCTCAGPNGETRREDCFGGSANSRYCKVARQDFAILGATQFVKDDSDFFLDAVAFEDAGNATYEESVSISGFVAGYPGNETKVHTNPVILSSSRDPSSKEMQLGVSRYYFLTRGMSGGPFVPNDEEFDGPFPRAIGMAWLGRKPQANGTFEEARYAFLHPPEALSELVGQSAPVQVALQQTRELKAATGPQRTNKLKAVADTIKLLRRTQLAALAFLLRTWPAAERITAEGTPTISAAFFARLSDRARKIGVSQGISALLEAFHLPLDPQELVHRADAQAAELWGNYSSGLLDQAEGAAYVAEPISPGLRELAADIASLRADVFENRRKDGLAAEWSLTNLALTGVVSSDLRVPTRVLRADPALFSTLLSEKGKLTRLSRAEKSGLVASKFLAPLWFGKAGTPEEHLLERQQEFVDKFQNPRALVVGNRATSSAMLLRSPIFVATGGNCEVGRVVSSRSRCPKRAIGSVARDANLRGIDLCRQSDGSVLPSGFGCHRGSWLGRTAVELQDEAEVPLYFARGDECGGPMVSTMISKSTCRLQFVGYSLSGQLDQELRYRASRSDSAEAEDN